MAKKSDSTLIVELIKKYALHPEDAYIHSQKKYKVINRKGYKKIQAIEKIKLKLILEYTNGLDSCVVRAIGGKHGQAEHLLRETYGEVSPRNSLFIYPHSVAQARAEGRLILELAGLYEQGFITEDEIDESFHKQKIVEDRKKVASDSVQDTLQRMNLTPEKPNAKT